MKVLLIIVAILFLSLIPNIGFSLSYRCTTTGSARVAKVFTIQDAEVDIGGGSAKNKKGYIALDDKRKIFGVSTRGASAVAQYIEFEAREQKYLIIVRIPTGIGNENPAYVDVMPESSYDNNLKHWVTCEKIDDTKSDNKEKKQDFCKLITAKAAIDVLVITEEEPVVTEEGNLLVSKYSNGAIVKYKKEVLTVESYTLPPGLKCQK
jgi:hypothetical protein